MSKRVKKDFLSLSKYLICLPGDVVDEVFTYSTACLAVYRNLPDVAKHYVIRMLFIEQLIPQAVVTAWTSQAYAEEHLRTVRTLTALRIWRESSIPGGLLAWEVHPTFKKSLKCALFGGGRTAHIRPCTEIDFKAKGLDYLDKYAVERWECVLHYMVGSEQNQGISADAVRVLLHAGLMENSDGTRVITNKGFQFLLLDTTSQVWYFILKYLDTVNSRGLNLVHCLTLLFEISFSILGKDYSTRGMDEGLLTFLQHLREFGLVYQRKRKEEKFYPTRLALSITSNCVAPITSTSIKTGYIIVESNFRVYAYTDSSLQIALIALFTQMLYRFPNLCVGSLTRESVCMAFRSGITALQIIDFLGLNAHPRLLAEPVPPTVSDQIIIWENERDRCTYADGVLYNQFLSQADFTMLKEYADNIGVLIWKNEISRAMIVSRDGHDEVKKFWKRQSKSGGY